MAKKGGKKKADGPKLTEDQIIERAVAARKGDNEKDEVDEFHETRNKVKLSSTRQSKRQQESSSEDEDGDFAAPETMLDLDMGSDEDDEDDEEDSDDSEGGKPPAGDGDSDDSDAKDEKFGWGKKKKAFYGDDDSEEDEEDDDMELAEEDEAMRLQKERAALLHEDDFGLGDEETFEQIQAKKDSKKTKGLGRSDAKLLSKVNADLEDIDVGDVEGVERLARDLTKLSESEKMQILITDSPELMTLLDEFKDNIKEIRTRIKPLLEKVKNGEVQTSSGVSFLELKFHLLLNYCLNFSFYILLKAEGVSVRDHPVIGQLVKIRTVLEKMKPIDSKLKYQIDKLVRTTTAPASGEDADALRYKPNPDRLMAKGADVEEQEDNLYRAPRMAAMAFEDNERHQEKKDRLLEKKRSKASKSQLVQALREEFGDAPEETTAMGLALRADDDNDAKERERYEEDNFIRMTLTKEEKKKKKKLARTKIDDFEDFDDFGDLVDVMRDATTKEEKLNQLKKKSLGDYITKIEQSKRKDTQGGDDDLPRNDRESKIKAQLKRKTIATLDEGEGDNEFFGGFGGGKSKNPEDFEDDFYKDAKADGQDKRAKKEAAYARDAVVHNPDGDVTDGRRKTTYQIDKNRGLTPHRKKEVRNSRVKLKNKYAKQTIKQKSTLRPVTTPSGPYGGEATGIKSNIARSVKIRN